MLSGTLGTENSSLSLPMDLISPTPDTVISSQSFATAIAVDGPGLNPYHTQACTCYLVFQAKTCLSSLKGLSPALTAISSQPANSLSSLGFSEKQTNKKPPRLRRYFYFLSFHTSSLSWMAGIEGVI